MKFLKSFLELSLLWVATIAFAWIPLHTLQVPSQCTEVSLDWSSYLGAAAPIVVTIVTPILVIAYVRSNESLTEFVAMIFSVYAFAITGYALAFYTAGIEDTARPGQVVTGFWNYLYFSTVTFTTVGYGDFRPCEGARIYAAVEGIFGGFFLPFSSAGVFLSKYLQPRRGLRGRGAIRRHNISRPPHPHSRMLALIGTGLKKSFSARGLLPRLWKNNILGRLRCRYSSFLRDFHSNRYRPNKDEDQQ